MKQQIQINSGKTITLPSRMFKPKDLKEMGVDFVEQKVLFNLYQEKDNFNDVDTVVAENMAIAHYRDFSLVIFSMEKLLRYVDEQLKIASDFIVLPYFKDETEYDIREKIRLAEALKQRTDKEIILEISYKSEIKTEELAELSVNFDFLAIYYGTYYGGYPSLEKLAVKVVEFKHFTGKKVFCTGVPLKFSGATRKEVRFMPCFDLLCDGWVKYWRRARGSKEMKVTDPKDFRCKTYVEWLETGHSSGEKLLPINRTVYELFNRVEESVAEHFQREIEDEILTEVHHLDPKSVDNYVFKKFHPQYVGLILTAYRTKLILTLFRENKAFERFSDEEKKLLEGKVREQYSTAQISDEIVLLAELAQRDTTISVPMMIEQVEAYRTRA